MKRTRIGRQALLKRAAVASLLALACFVLSGCYMEPDPVVNTGNGLDIGNQGFQNVITPTPNVTASPTPAPTSNQIDWSSWNFGDTTATNPPSGVTPTTTIASITPTISTGGLATSQVVKTPAPTVSTGGSGTSTTKAPTATSSTLKVGSTGSAVKRLQQRLKDLGYYTGSVDGDYGSGTEQAVRDFQSAHGLTVDGKAGTRTQEAVYSANAKTKRVTATATPRPASGGGTSTGGSGSSTRPSNRPSTGTTANAYTNGKTDIYLKLGSSGSQVKILQNRLIYLGYLSGTADGEFAETTEAAVKAFQKRNNIYDDGIAGPDTLTKLYSSSAKKASSVVANLGSLKAGANGNDVRALQQNLKTLGYYTGTVDGDYGTGTTTAVTAFQRDHGLKADGIAGKATLNAIYAALNGGSTSGGGTSSGSTSGSSSTNPKNYGASASSNGYTTISAGSKTSTANVTALQSALKSTGFYSGTVDGSYGSGTENAVSAYQRAVGLRVTGMAGPSTQRLLYGGTEATGSYSKLQLGSSGSAVKRLQYALYELKYYDGNITGKYDAATESAVMTFQEVNGLYIDGVAGQDTQRKLFSSYALPCTI